MGNFPEEVKRLHGTGNSFSPMEQMVLVGSGEALVWGMNI